MTCPWLQPPTGRLAAAQAAIARAIPRIETPRLVLRAPHVADWETLAPIWTTSRAVHFGGPFAEDEGWRDFCQMVAGWVLRGTGALTVEAKADGAVLGLVAIHHEWGDAEIELGWLLTADAEGKGYGAEAAGALRDHAFATLGLTRLVSYVGTGNLRSAALARRLGARPDPAAELSGPNDDGDTVVFRHPDPTEPRQEADPMPTGRKDPA